MKIMFDRMDSNFHARKREGENSNYEDAYPVTGPAFRWIKLQRGRPGYSRRLIFYFSSGAWWHLDIYSKDRWW